MNVPTMIYQMMNLLDTIRVISVLFRFVLLPVVKYALNVLRSDHKR